MVALTAGGFYCDWRARVLGRVQLRRTGAPRPGAWLAGGPRGRRMSMVTCHVGGIQERCLRDWWRSVINPLRRARRVGSSRDG